MSLIYKKISLSEVHSELYQTSNMKFTAKIGNGVRPLTIVAKHSISDIWQGSEYASGYLFDKGNK